MALEPLPIADSSGAKTIDLLRFVPDEHHEAFRSAVKSSLIERTPNAFQSDGWSAATVEGVLKLNGKLAGKKIAEVGVGAGTVSIIVAAVSAPEKLDVSDYVASHIDLTRSNVARVLSEKDAARFAYHEGSTNLLDWTKGGEDIDVLIACIPQVVKAPGVVDSLDDEANYIPDDVLAQLRSADGSNGRQVVQSQKEFLANIRPDDFDLDLNMALLQQARESGVLSDDGFVCLTLGGRPGDAVLFELIRREGYEPNAVHTKIVRQDPHTDIASLEAHEGHLKKLWPGYSFVFFEDQEATEPIGAARAAELLDAGQPVFHQIFIVQCKPVSNGAAI